MMHGNTKIKFKIYVSVLQLKNVEGDDINI